MNEAGFSWFVSPVSVCPQARLGTSPGTFSRGKDELSGVLDSEPPPLPQPSFSQSSAVQWRDLAAIQSQLQLQSQAVESLTDKLRNMDLERHSQQRHIQALEEEVHRLREQTRERGRDEERRAQSPGSERMMEQWRREMSRELSSLRGHVTRATSLGNLEESFSSKLRREELDQLRRELDQLKTQLRRQEEDMFLKNTESRDTRRQYERFCKMLEELTDGYKTHSIDLAKTVSQYTHTQQEVRQIRETVTELKDELSQLTFKDRLSSPIVQPFTTALSPVPAPVFISSVRVQREAEPDSDSEDFSPTPSLAEVSSDDLSWLEDRALDSRQGLSRRRPRSRGEASDLGGVGSDFDDEDNDDDDHGDGNLGLGSDLSLNDL